MSSQTAVSPRQDWKWVTLADVAKVVTGNTPPTADAQNYGDAIPFVKPTELVDRGIRFAPVGLADQALGKARVVPAGAVLVSCIGNLGKTGLAKVPMAFNQQINAVVFNEKVVPEFGFYYAQTLKSWLYGESSATTLPIINKGKFQQAPFPLAPIAEQREIVAELEKQFSRLDEAVANLKRVKANLKRYKASVLKDAVEGRLVPTEADIARSEGRGFEAGEQLLQRILEARRSQWKGKGKFKTAISPEIDELHELPDGWTWCATDQVCEKITDGEHISPSIVSDGIPLLSAKDVLDAGVTFDDAKYVMASDAEKFRSRCDPDRGDILIVSRGATIGRACRVNTDRVFSLMGSVILMKPTKLVEAGYLMLALKAGFFLTRLTAVSGSTAQQAIYIRDVRPLQLPLPPVTEQLRISAEVDRLLSLVRGVETEVDANLKRSQALRQATLNQAFRLSVSLN